MNKSFIEFLKDLENNIDFICGTKVSKLQLYEAGLILIKEWNKSKLPKINEEIEIQKWTEYLKKKYNLCHLESNPS